MFLLLLLSEFLHLYGFQVAIGHRLESELRIQNRLGLFVKKL